jgi:hypothetical protein
VRDIEERSDVLMEIRELQVSSKCRVWKILRRKKGEREMLR